MGGAISAENSGNVSIVRTEFSRCKAEGSGGAIATIAAEAFEVDNCTFSQNIALGAGGGAVYSKRSSLLIQYSAYLENSATYGGGGCLFWEGIMEPLLIPSPDANHNFGVLNAAIVDGSMMAGNAGNNQAIFGPCLASSAKVLSLAALPSISPPPII